jgi:hypothetical protein
MRERLVGSGWAAALLATTTAFAACGTAASDAANAGEAPGGGFGGTGGAGGGFDAGVDSGPPEMELESSFQSPVATGRFVWSANPTSGRVAYVDAETLEVSTVEAGNAPTWLAAVPDAAGDTALVLNVLSSDATLLRKSAAGLASQTFPVAAGANRWTLSADGRWAVAWADASRVPGADSTEGFQDLSVIDLAKDPPASRALSVGYRPSSVVVDDPPRHVYAVTADGVSVVDLAATGGPQVTSNVVLQTADAGAGEPARDVSITPDGAWAAVRRDGSADVDLVDLASGERHPITLHGPVTDLDLAPDGSQAVAVVRDTSEVVVIPLPLAATDPRAVRTIAIDGASFGSVVLVPGQPIALLYTNASELPAITALTLGATSSWRTIRLYAPVLSVFPSPDGAHAIVLHAHPGAGSTKQGAFSVVPVAAALPAKIVGTDAPPTSVAIAPGGDRALVTVRDDARKVWGAYLARMPSLEVDAYALASPPIAAGVVAGAASGYVAQEHPDGRITFVDLGSGAARTLTGFELGARVVDGSGRP